MNVAKRPNGPADPVGRVLLLHGIGSSRHIWNDLVPLLSDDLEIWDADLPWGAEPGRDWAPDLDAPTCVADSVAAVDGPVDAVVAHSFAANALLAGLDGGATPVAPAVVLISPFFRRTREEFDWDVMSYYLNDFRRIFTESIRVQSGGSIDRDIQREMGERVRDRVGPYGWVRFFDTYLRTPFLDLHRVTARSLVVGGEHDFAAQPTDSVALARSLPNCRVEILPDSSHFPMVEQPAELAALLRDFLASPVPDLLSEMELPT